MTISTSFFEYPLKDIFSSFCVLILVSNYSTEGNKTTLEAKLREHPEY